MTKDFSKNVEIRSIDVAESLFSEAKPSINIKEKKKVMLRMEPELYEELVAEAKSEHRSLNSYILTVLDHRQKNRE